MEQAIQESAISAEQPVLTTQAETPAQVEVQKEPAKKDDFAIKLEALAQKEARIRAQERAWKEERKQILEKLEKYKEFDDLPSKAKDNPRMILDKFGLSYEDLTNFILDENGYKKENSLKSLESKISDLEKKLVEKEKSESEFKVQQAVSQYKAEVSAHLKANKDKYELISTREDGIDLVKDVALEYYQKNDTILDIDEACSLVETHLEKELEQYLSLNKIKSKFAMPVDNQQQSLPSGLLNKPKTLTNEMTPTTSSHPIHMSEEDRLKEAAKLIKFI